MRKGYTIIEIIILTSLVVLVFMLMNEPIRMMISDISRQHREFQTAQSLNHMFNHLKTDIEASRELSAGEPNTLIIDGRITYHFDRQAVRRTIGDDLNTTSLWTLPDSCLAWEVKNHKALQITGWLERERLAKKEIKFHNSHLFYAKGFKSGETQ